MGSDSGRAGKVRRIFIVSILVVSQLCPKPASTQGAPVAISSFSLQTPFVCPGENALLTWSIAADDASALLRCEFDREGDGIIDEVIANCPRSGELSFQPTAAGAIQPRMKVILDGVTMAVSRTQGAVHEPLEKRYSSAAESLRFGSHGPADFYATDVAIGQDGKVYLTDWFRRRVYRYSGAGTLELEYPQLVGQPRRLAVDGSGRVYVSEAPLGVIHVYDAAGLEVDAWDMTTKFGYGVGTGGIEFVAPDRVLIAAADTVLVVSLEGDLLFQFGAPGQEPGQFSSIFDVAQAPDGSYFVVDRTHRLHKFDAAGIFLWSRGGYGTDPGLFDVPVAVSVAPSGNVYVSDRRNYRVQEFDQDGNFLLAWGGKGSDAGLFNWHYGMDVDDATGDVWVAGYHGHDVQKFSSAGQPLDRWIGHLTAPDEFAYAAGIAVSDERIFVVDQINQQIKVFDKATQSPLYQFGERGDGPGTVFNFPRAVTLAPAGELYVTEDRIVRRLQQDGTFIRMLNSLTKNISASMGLFVESDTLYQAGTNNSLLFARNALSGKLVWSAGSTGLEPGQFTRIWGIAPGAGGMLLATDAGSRVQLFTKEGQYVRQWLTVQPGTTTAAPSRGIAFDPGRRIVYVGSGSTINAYDMCGSPLFSWTPAAPVSPGLLFDHLTVDGQGTVFATDHFGTVYGVVPVEDTPTPDTTPPTGTLSINADAATTRSAAATLTLMATDVGGGALQMCVSDTTSCGAWTAFTSTRTWSLPDGEGTKTVYAWFKDQWGNTSDAVSDTISLDTVAPAKGTASLTPGNLQLTLNVSGFTDAGGSGIAGYVASFLEGATPPSSCASGTPLPGSGGPATTLVHSGLSDGTTYAYKVCAVDAAGNRSPGATVTGKPLFDPTPPSGTVTINAGATATRSTAATLTLTATDPESGQLQMCISDTTDCSAWTAFAGTLGWTLPAGAGAKTIYARFRDQAGNTSEAYRDSIELDTVAPAKGTVAVTPGSLQLTLDFSDFSDSGGSGVVGYVTSFREGTMAPSSCASGTLVPGSGGPATTLVHNGLAYGRTYTYKVCALDAAGNRSPGAIRAGTPGP